MEPLDRDTIVHFIQSCLEKVKPKLENEAVKTIEHYIYHNENEMAFEGLFIEIMNLDSYPLGIDKEKSRAVALALKLNEESVFDYHFWGKFNQYLNMQT